MAQHFVHPPLWEWYIVWYFFLGGLAGGLYMLGTLLRLVGDPRDQGVARLAFLIAFPAMAICPILLTLDLGHPLRFWHMLIDSRTWGPMFKYWSPMSVGAWALLLFGAFSAASFVGALAEEGRFGLGRFSGVARVMHFGPIGMLFELAGTAVGFFIAAYTGALLTASNQPFWSDSTLIGALFLASAASTGIATLLLIMSFVRRAPPDSVVNLERTDRWAILLELVLLVAFVLSLGGLMPAFISNPYGILLLVGTLLAGVLVPLLLNWRPRLLGSSSTIVAALLALIGGLILRYAIVMAGQHVTIAGL